MNIATMQRRADTFPLNTEAIYKSDTIPKNNTHRIAVLLKLEHYLFLPIFLIAHSYLYSINLLINQLNERKKESIFNQSTN